MFDPDERRVKARGWPSASLPFACLVAVALRLPTFRYALVSDDEAIYDAMAQVITHGGTMYRDTVDHKPPGLAYTYAAVRDLVEHLGGSFGAVLTGVHLLGVAVVVLTCIVVHAIARELLAPRLAPLAALLYAIASATSVAPDALAVNGELLMNLPTALAVLAALRATREETSPGRRFLWNLAAGAACGVAALYKYQAVLIFVAVLCLLPDPRRGAAFFRSALGRASTLALGLISPFAGAALFFWERGALHDAVDWGLLFNVHYLAEGPDLEAAALRLAMQLLGVVLPSALVYGAAVYAAYQVLRTPGDVERHGVRRGRALLLVWALESLYCVTLGRRFFGHYFLQLDLPFSLLAAGPIANLWERHRVPVIAALAAPALVFFVISVVPEVSRRLVFAADPDYEALGRAVAETTSKDDTIWVWGNVPQVYFTAERRPGVRFTFCNYLTGLSPGSRSESDPTYDSRKNAVPGAWDLVVHDLDAEAPAVIVDTAAGGMKSYGKFPIDSFPVLSAYVKSHYVAGERVEGAVLYHRAVLRGSP